MKRAFKEQDIELTNPVILTVTPPEYSMAVAVGLLSWLEGNGAIISDTGWKSNDHGNLVETGIKIKFEDVVFSISCRYEHVYFERISGKESSFWALCKLFCETEI